MSTEIDPMTTALALHALDAEQTRRDHRLNHEAWRTLRAACLEAFRMIGMALPCVAPANFARTEADWLQCPRYDLWLPGWRATRILCRVRLAYDPAAPVRAGVKPIFRSHFTAIVAPFLYEGGFIAGRLGIPVWKIQLPERTLVKLPMAGWRWVNDYAKAVRISRSEEYRRIRLAGYIGRRVRLEPPQAA